MEHTEGDEADMDIGDVVLRKSRDLSPVIHSHHGTACTAESAHNAGLVVGIRLNGLLTVEWSDGCRSYEARFNLMLDRSEAVPSNGSEDSEDSDGANGDGDSCASDGSWSTVDSETEFLEKQESVLPAASTTQGQDMQDGSGIDDADSWSTVDSDVDDEADDEDDSHEQMHDKSDVESTSSCPELVSITPPTMVQASLPTTASISMRMM